ncbi:glycoside hydrolase family 9 protein [Ceraceosorus bombacis]|uniref:cellulase n=1 Tax=Ceraceosorus bombacis TaxID=401625 RepID=A0A0P1BT71_9BASI|nr:glycoside hydrolase family 9 protein [Ceraceosorus bombacis]
MRPYNNRKAAQWSLLAVFSALLLCEGARGQRQVSLQATDLSDVVTSSTYLDTAGSTDSGSSAAPTPTSSTLPVGSAAVSTVDDDDDPSAAASAWQPPPTQSATVPSPDGVYPNPQWSSLLGKTLYFYDIQRAGQLPSNFRVKWRDSSSTSDGSDEGLDLTKGFFDAGNFIKATFPLSWTLQQLAWAGAMYGESFDSTGQTKYLNRTMRVGLDWLLEASSKPDTVVVQVSFRSID